MTDPILQSAFLFENAPFDHCHAATIAATDKGLVAAFFAGSREGNVDVAIWLTRLTDGGWSPPQIVATGKNTDDTRYPCWNPVLFQPNDGPLLLFYKVGPSPATWWGMLMSSDDAGLTWSAPRRLPAGIDGPSKNKPLQLEDGTLLCPASSEQRGWQVWLQRTPDLGQSWQTVGPLNDGRKMAAIQPTILIFPDGVLQLLCRSKSGSIVTCRSTDGGQSWAPLCNTSLPNPNCGIDAVSLNDGRALLVYNHAGCYFGSRRGPRSPLNIAVSADGGHWQAGLVLENDRGEYSYPAVIQTRDNLVHVIYTWRRQNIRHVVIDPARLNGKPITNRKWPIR